MKSLMLVLFPATLSRGAIQWQHVWGKGAYLTKIPTIYNLNKRNNKAQTHYIFKYTQSQKKTKGMSTCKANKSKAHSKIYIQTNNENIESFTHTTKTHTPKKEEEKRKHSTRELSILSPAATQAHSTVRVRWQSLTVHPTRSLACVEGLSTASFTICPAHSCALSPACETERWGRPGPVDGLVCRVHFQWFCHRPVRDSWDDAPSGVLLPCLFQQVCALGIWAARVSKIPGSVGGGAAFSKEGSW